ncbi:MAG TPA: MarR family transcriptional regulator [Phenylobacterium sp.]|nr:MarR family transcriptional regulator [Phenylobacterium sp.]
MAKAKSAGKRAGLPALDRSPSHLLHRALQLALDIYAEEIGAGGLTQRQYAVLAAVEAHEGQTQTDLVRTTGIDRSTLADMAARMIVKGLLERQRSASDARANAVTLTDAGRAALEDARPRMAAADTRLLKLISGGKRETLTGLLRDLVRAGDEAAAPMAEKPAKKAKAPKVKKVKAAKAPKPEKSGKKKIKKAA